MSASPVNSKNKTAAILLAVFLGFWTWLYTYKKDGWKFWVSLSLTVVGMFVMAYTTSRIIIARNESGILTDLVIAWIAAWVIAYIITGGLWIWGIVDTAIKKSAWYDNYPN